MLPKASGAVARHGSRVDARGSIRIVAVRAIAGALALASVAACTGSRTPEGGSTATETASTGSPSVAPSTPGAAASPVVVAVKGDFGSGSQAQAAVTRRMCAVREKEPFLDVLTTGDNFYDPDGTATAANYERPEACLTRYPGHRWRATWGNHDVEGRSTGSVLGARRWYAWSAGSADFFALDSNSVGDHGQRAWLVRRLSASTAPVKIVFFHHSPFTTGSVHRDDQRVRREWVPLFERFGVILVLTGHTHLYEHSLVHGIDYVVTGGGGRDLYACVRNPPTLVRCEPSFHFLLLRIDRNGVDVHAIDSSGETIDRVRIEA